MSTGFGGGNGQWVRTRTEEGAKAFLAERQLAADHARTRRELLDRAWDRLRTWTALLASRTRGR